MKLRTPVIAVGSQAPWGFQLVLDCFGCDEEVCCDLERGYEFLDKICTHLGLTKQTEPHILKTGSSGPGHLGFHGWMPVVESGIQIHTSASNRFISVDIYSCKPFEVDRVVDFVKRWFEPKQIDTCFLHRGKDVRQRRFAASLLETAAAP